jgi:hypothetical protein
MICPSCKCQYLPGVRQCPDCDVALVDALEPAAATPPGDDSVVSIWSGNDPREFAAVKEALDKAQIPFMGPVSTGYFIFPSMRPKMEIGVSVTDRERAEKVLEDLEGQDDPSELSPEELEKLALPDSGGVDQDEIASASSDVPEDWDDQHHVNEVWKGDDEDFANTLTACFRENGIPSRKITDENHWRLVVPSGQEARAKEIVREVVEGAPPE